MTPRRTWLDEMKVVFISLREREFFLTPHQVTDSILLPHKYWNEATESPLPSGPQIRTAQELCSTEGQ